MSEDTRETSPLPISVGRGWGLGQDELRRGEWLLARITDFTRLLWELGLDVGPGRVVELAQSLPLVNVSDPTAFYLFLKVSLVSKHEQQPIFDQAFAYFWRAAGGADADGGANDDPRNQRRLALPSHRQRPEDKAHARPALAPGERTRHPASRLRDARRQRNVDEEDPAEHVGLFSQEEALRRKDFEDFTWAELQEARELMARMRWRLGMRQTRRLRPARRGEQLDLRNTFRRSLRSGGEPLTLLRRQRRRKPRPLVILCDISGSMSLYSRLLLQFVHTVSNGLENVETFVFGTRLTRITRQLARRDVDEALADVSRIVQDWSGGTRIGESFRTFNFQWSRRALGRGAVVLVISDGWDRGDTRQLATEMARLHRNCHRLIWLNPLLGQDDYRPVTAGMRAALPYIDDFLPSHNLDSLFALGRLLEAVDDTARSAHTTRPTTGAAATR